MVVDAACSRSSSGRNSSASTTSSSWKYLSSPISARTARWAATQSRASTTGLSMMTHRGFIWARRTVALSRTPPFALMVRGMLALLDGVPFGLGLGLGAFLLGLEVLQGLAGVRF